MTFSKSVKSPIAMHPLKVDAMVKEARIIVLVKDGEIWGLAKLKRLPKLSQFQLVLYTLIVILGEYSFTR